jgi:purine-cytosine permease-like protein
LIAIGFPVKRHIAALLDGLIMLAGTIYIVWFAENFFFPFQGFLITLGVPVATWSAIFVTDALLRKREYSEADLYREEGRYGTWNLRSLLVMAIGTIIGWGFVTNSFASWLSWQGYFMDLIGGKEGSWAYANVGVLLSLAIGSLGHLLLSRKKISAQETA